MIQPKTQPAPVTSSPRPSGGGNQSAPRPDNRPRPDRAPRPEGYERIIETVAIPYNYAYYGQRRENSPNRMYKKYLAWFMSKYGTSKTPLTFKEWLKWAKSKGLIESFVGAEGKTQEVFVQKNPESEAEKVAKVAMSAGKKIGLGLAVATALVLVVSFANSKG